MTGSDRVTIKEWSKKELNSNFSFYLVLCICALLAYFLTNGIAQWPNLHNTDINEVSTSFMSGWLGSSFLIGLIASLLQSSAMFAMIDIQRDNAEHKNAMQRAFSIFDNGQYFIGWIIITIITTVLTFLWSLLLFIPGIVKSFSYSQALLIYRDSVKAGHPMGYMEAITESRKRMDGKKGFLFIFDLSFLGWFILTGFTAGILGIWVYPYYWIATIKFYTDYIATDEKQPYEDESEGPKHFDSN